MGKALFLCLLLCACQPRQAVLPKTKEGTDVVAYARQLAATMPVTNDVLRRLSLPNQQVGYLSSDSRYMILCRKECLRHDSKQIPLVGVAHQPSPIVGLEEFVLPQGQIVYADPEISDLYTGHIIDLRNGQDLTQARMTQDARVRWNQLVRQRTSTEVLGNGQQALALLTGQHDPADLLKIIRQLHNVTLYIVPGATPIDPSQLPALLTPDGRILSLASWQPSTRAFLSGVMTTWLAQKTEG